MLFTMYCMRSLSPTRTKRWWTLFKEMCESPTTWIGAPKPYAQNTPDYNNKPRYIRAYVPLSLCVGNRIHGKPVQKWVLAPQANVITLPIHIQTKLYRPHSAWVHFIRTPAWKETKMITITRLSRWLVLFHGQIPICPLRVGNLILSSP